MFERAFTYKTSQGEKGRIAGRKKLPAGPPRTSAAGRSLFCCLLFVLSVSLPLRLSASPSLRLSASPSLRLSVSPSPGAAPRLFRFSPFSVFRCPSPLPFGPSPFVPMRPLVALRPYQGKGPGSCGFRGLLGEELVSAGPQAVPWGICCWRRELSFSFFFFPPPLRPVGCQKSVWLSSPRERAGRSGWPSRMRACERAASVMRLPESILAISVVRSSAVSRVMEVRPSRL